MIAICKRPVGLAMIERGGRALWDQYREIEGRVEWDDAADFAREPYELKAMRCLEAGLPQDVEFLRQMIKECEHLIDVL
jgi:hypothetical protein